MALPQGVIVDGPQPASTEQKSKAQLSNFEEWALGGRFEHMASSCVESAAYDAMQGRLKVRFKNGGGGKWYGISLEKAQLFYNAPSKMGWIWSNCLVRGPGHKGQTQVESGDL